MREISVYPDVYLGHSETTRRTYNTRTVTTWYTAVRIPLPEEGMVAHEVTCRHCGRTITWKVLSAARTARARLRWLLIGLAGLLVVIGGIAAINIYGDSSNPNVGLVWLAVIVFIGGVVALFAGPVMWFTDQGVRVPQMRHGPRRPRRGMPHVPS
jgi:hypothetical protein